MLKILKISELQGHPRQLLRNRGSHGEHVGMYRPKRQFRTFIPVPAVGFSLHGPALPSVMCTDPGVVMISDPHESVIS